MNDYNYCITFPGTTNRKEKDSRQEANIESGLQREFRIRHSNHRGQRSNTRRRLTGADAAWLGSCHQERGHRSVRAGWTAQHRISVESLEGSVQLTEAPDRRLAQAAWINCGELCSLKISCFCVAFNWIFFVIPLRFRLSVFTAFDKFPPPIPVFLPRHCRVVERNPSKYHNIFMLHQGIGLQSCHFSSLISLEKLRVKLHLKSLSFEASTDDLWHHSWTTPHHNFLN